MSIDVNVQNDLVIVTESSEDITVNVSNAAGPAGVGVPIGGTTGQVLKKFTNTNYDTYWAADASGLTSVGLSMPSAFAVSNSPLTSNGTIAVTGAGTTSQYIRGDGQLANFPDNGGGGSSVNYYLNGSVTQGTFGGTTYYEMSKTPVLGAGTNFTRTNAQGNGYIASFITDAGDPSLLNIPGGNWNVEFYFASSASGGSPQFYAELYKVSSADVFTLVASGSSNPEGITNGTTVDQYFTSIPVPQTSLLVTDRLAVRIYVITSGRTITLHTENSNLCEILTTFSTGLNALNGLTAQVQYFATGTSGTDFAISSATDTHTFNLPTASATNRGALSSADWSTFSGKIGGSGTSGQVAYWNGTSSQAGSNNLFWDAANSRLGIGTNAPALKLSVITSGGANFIQSAGFGDVSSQSGYILLEKGRGTSSSPTALLSGDILGSINFRGYYTSSNVSTTFSIFAVASSNFTSLVNPVNLIFRKFATDGNTTDLMRLVGETGNLIIQNGGTFTDGGQRLQVQGDAFIKGSGNTSATNALLVDNSDGTDLFIVNNVGQVNFGSNYIRPFATFPTASPTGTNLLISPSNVTSTGATDGALFLRSLTVTGTSGAFNLAAFQSIFSPTSGTQINTTLLINPQINQTGGANGITRGLYVNPTLTAAADWRSIEWSNNSGWGLYGAGTANNYLGGSLGIGTTSLTGYNLRISKNITGAIGSSGIAVDGIILSDVTSAAASYSSRPSTDNASFNLGSLVHFSAGQGTFRSGSSVSDQFGFLVNNELIGATNNYAFFGNIPNGTNRWNIYMNGTADNYLRGKLLINTTTVGTFNLDVNGTARVSGASTFNGNMSLSINGNLPTTMTISNTTSASNAGSALICQTDTLSGLSTFGKYSTTNLPFKIVSAGDGYLYNTLKDIAILNDATSGAIKFAAGGSSTAHMTIKSNGRINMSSLPTSATGLSAGDIWNDGGTLKIV